MENIYPIMELGTASWFPYSGSMARSLRVTIWKH